MRRRAAPVPRMVDLEALIRTDYELHGRRSTRCLSGKFAHLNRHFVTFDPARAYDLTVRYALARRGERAAPATVRYEIALLGRALTLALRRGLIDTKPLLARPTVQNARRGFVGRHQLGPLLAALPDPIADLTLFGYVTGWRKREILGLTWDRVDLGAGVARLEAEGSKNAEARTYPVGAHPELRRMLERRWLTRRGPWVFHRKGRPVLWFDRTWKKACRASGLGSTLFHDLRRSAVRNMERAGVPRSVAMQLTGHKTESIYRRYAITNEEDLARGVRLIAALSQEEHSSTSPHETAKR